MPKPDAIQPVARTKHIFLLVYGNSGVGKTRLIGSLGGRTLIVRPPTEHTDSIRTPDGIDEWVVRTWSDMAEVEEFLHHEGKDNYDWVWLDSISLFQDTGLDDIWSDVIAEKPHRNKYGLDKGEYGINMGRLGRWVRGIIGIDQFNFGVTAHPFEGEDLDGNTILMPYVQGKGMALKISGYMNMVAYYEVKETGKGSDKKLVRVLRTNLTDRYYAKDQFDALEGDGYRMVNPTLPKLIEKIDAARPKAARKTPVKKTTARRRTRRTATSKKGS